MLALVLVTQLLSTSFLPPAGAAELVTWKCDNGTYYAANSTYESNVRSLLSSIASNASLPLFPGVGFATAVLGTSPDTVWGLGLCRGDTNGSDCESCLALAPEVAFGHCKGVKDVTVFYDRCILRYSSKDFLTKPNNREVQDREISGDSVTSNAGWYNALVVNLTGALSDWAAFNTTTSRYYAVGVMDSDQGFPATDKAVVHRIIGLVQCTPNQAPGTCRQCLQGLIDDMPAVFNASVGGRLLGVWCNLRFEVHEFYDGSPMLNIVAPQLMSPPPPASTPPPPASGGPIHKEEIIGIVVSISVIGLLVVFIIIRHYQRKWSVANILKVREFSYSDIRRATGNFRDENLLGKGGFGQVYKGKFNIKGNETILAVKRLTNQVAAKELLGELEILAKLQHVNVVRLVGFCSDDRWFLFGKRGKGLYICNEYLSEGSLQAHIFGNKRGSLRWSTRYEIIRGICAGVWYLHDSCNNNIWHMDLKPSNILLNKDMKPKIADFGLSRMIAMINNRTHTYTENVIGTPGYMAPEFVKDGRVSHKCDIYSLGVVIMGIVMGEGPTDYDGPCGSQFIETIRSKFILEEAQTPSTPKKCSARDRTQLKEDASLLDNDCLEDVEKCIGLALECVDEDAEKRPKATYIYSYLPAVSAT